MPSPTVEYRQPGAGPRLDGLTPAALQQLQVAAHAIRDGACVVAAQALDAVLATSPGHPEALRLHAILHARAHRHAEAEAALQQAIAQWPDYALAHSDLGNVQQSAGELDAAFASWRQACMLAPQAPMPWFNLGRNLQLHGDTAAAIEALQQAHALAPGFLPALILLGDALVHAGRFDEADTRYRAALRACIRPAATPGAGWRTSRRDRCPGAIASNWRQRCASPTSSRATESRWVSRSARCARTRAITRRPSPR